MNQLRHCQVGGATDFEVLWCNNNGTDNTTPSKLQRKIGDYIDYGMPPTSSFISSSAIPHTKILPIKRMFEPISFPTHYVRSGIGIKKLSIAEFIKLFGLSSRASRLKLTFKSFPTVPVQILDTLFAPYYRQNNKSPNATHNISRQTTLPQEHADFLPTLGCKLPPDWKEQQVTSAIVAKDDNAEIQTHMWDKRVSMLYPSFTSAVLDTLRTLVLVKIFKDLYKEFVQFMAKKHGASWFELISTGGYSALNNYGGWMDEELGKYLTAGLTALISY